jgi:O-acetyl-ADP-ribose deacetylase (regulator of RNase III)
MNLPSEVVIISGDSRFDPGADKMKKLEAHDVTERQALIGPKWIINFPTKEHWRGNSKMAWIEDGLEDLKRVIAENKIRSIAIPPLGSGNGGLNWADVRPKIEAALGELNDVSVLIYEPTDQYQNVSKR